MAEPVLRVERAFKRFGGLLAVDNASLAVEAGRITALIGPNGAGKTTLFSIISGFMPPSEGHIFHRGADITGMPPHLVARRGIVRTFQIVQPFAGLTVHENIAIGAHLSRRSRAEALDAAAEVASTVGLGDLLGICHDARAPRRSTLPRKLQAQWASAISSAVRPRASRSPVASGWKSHARSPPNPNSFCSTRCLPASTPPRSPR